MNILITGISGHIGSFLEQELSKTHNVFGVSRKKQAKNITNLDLLNVKQSEIKSVLEKNKIDLVIHCAVNLQPDNIDDFYLNSFVLNKFFTCDLSKHIRYIVIGSAAEYGEDESRIKKTSEETLPIPGSPYGISKFLQTSVCNYYYNQMDYDITVLRVFNIISPFLSKKSFVGNLINQVEHGNKGKIEVNNLEIERDFLDIRDLTGIISKIVEKRSSSFLYNVGSGKNISYGYFLDSLFSVLNKENLLLPNIINNKKEEKFQNTECNISKITSEYVWKPKYSLEQSIKWCLKERKIIS